MDQPKPFLFIFGLFKQNITIFRTIFVGKIPSSIWCWDLNPRPLGRECPPIVTRPGLPPNLQKFCQKILKPILNFFFFLFSRQQTVWRETEIRRGGRPAPRLRNCGRIPRHHRQQQDPKVVRAGIVKFIHLRLSIIFGDFYYFIFKWAIHCFFFGYFCLFKQSIQFLQQINVKNVQ